jgi:serine/threonine protein kinase
MTIEDAMNDGNASPTLALSEIQTGRVVGQGGFCMVCKVEKIELNEVFETSETNAKLRSNFAATLRENQYVMKTLRTDLPEEEYVKGIVDLAIEAEFLSVLAHPNIICMRAIANSDPHETKFFVILDRLLITLDRKFNQWRREVGENSGYWMGPFGYCCAKEHFLYKTWLERLTASRDIANAIFFLHNKSIVYRDLKPDNLGFDVSGALKLFDFGLAKRMDTAEESSDGMYLLTGNTGSLRYMAPEVAKGEPYNQTVDAYSFGMLFWQICSLQTPFAGMSARTHADRVIRRGERPKPDRSWPLSWIDIMTRAWAPDTKKRPDFDEIAIFLETQVEEMDGNDGEIPCRATEIKARKKNKRLVTERLDVDTRISTDVDGPIKKYDKEVV